MACSVLNKRNNNDSVGIFYLLFHLLLIHLHPDSIYISVLPFEFLDLMLRKTRFLSNVTLITDTSYSLFVVISERKTICLCVTGALEQGGKTMAPCPHTPTLLLTKIKKKQTFSHESKNICIVQLPLGYKVMLLTRWTLFLDIFEYLPPLPGPVLYIWDGHILLYFGNVLPLCFVNMCELYSLGLGLCSIEKSNYHTTMVTSPTYYPPTIHTQIAIK